VIDAWVIDDGIDGRSRERIEESAHRNTKIHWLPSRGNELSGLPLWGRMPATTYEKLSIADSLSEDITKIIWLDCDMLVLADLVELWNMPLDGRHLLAVTDALIPTFGSRFGVTGWQQLGCPKSSAYFNAGVMVIDPAKWRASGVSHAAIDYVKRFRNGIYYWDQQALNAVLCGLWGAVDERWNWSATLDRLHNGKTELPSSRIIHFNGNLKPWVVREAMSFDTEYFRVVDTTAWKGWRPQRTLARSALGWYGSSRIRRALYPAEQWGVHMLWHLTQRPA
jgi:lipopolysaccharide biosynthesis glycosyltransferase